MASWNFLTNHGKVLLCIAYDPQVRLRDIAASLSITERRAYGIINDLSEAGYVVKEKGRSPHSLSDPRTPTSSRHPRTGAGRRRCLGLLTGRKATSQSDL